MKPDIPAINKMRRAVLEAQAKAYHDAPLIRAMEIAALEALQTVQPERRSL